MLEKISPFGPFIGKGKLSPALNKKLVDIVFQDGLKPANKQLVGYIEIENDILEYIPEDLMKQMESFVIDYVNNIDSGFYKDVVPLPSSVVTCVSAWANIQKHMEFNPYHNHAGYDLVCLIFPKLSIKEPNPYEANYSDAPGSLILVNGHRMASGFNTSSYSIIPEEGDVYIFPADLCHYTTPVFGDDYRVSVSSNFILNGKARTLLNKISGKR